VSGPFEKYVEQAAEAAYDSGNPTWPWRDLFADEREPRIERMRAALAAVGPLIQEDSAVTALAPMVERVAGLVERLAAAENVCAMLATAADGIDEDTRHKATAVLWQEWAAQPDVSLDPAAFPHLTKPVAERLAAMHTTTQETRA
jgi:hypothetical protein